MHNKRNVTHLNIVNNTEDTISDSGYDLMTILSATIASVGIIANLTVVTAFLSNKRCRRKIPNVFIINQVRKRSAQ